MSNDCLRVDASVTVRSLVDDLLMRTGRRCVIVSQDSQVLGMITPNEVRTVDRSRWMTLTAADIMRPLHRLRTIAPEATANDAFKAMATDDVNQLPVVSGDRLEGVVTRGQILQVLKSRTELGQ
jgi:predicted transcriptional regulator